jgi:hypothetical protein
LLEQRDPLVSPAHLFWPFGLRQNKCGIALSTVRIHNGSICDIPAVGSGGSVIARIILEVSPGSSSRKLSPFKIGLSPPRMDNFAIEATPRFKAPLGFALAADYPLGLGYRFDITLGFGLGARNAIDRCIIKARIVAHPNWINVLVNEASNINRCSATLRPFRNRSATIGRDYIGLANNSRFAFSTTTHPCGTLHSGGEFLTDML